MEKGRRPSPLNQSGHYGKYKGVVIDNQDPERMCRVRVRVPLVLGDAVSGWALPCLPFGGMADQGFYCVPETGALVWVEFEGGDLNWPIWSGTWWGKPDEAPAASPASRVFKTPAGQILEFNDEPGEVKFRIVHPGGHRITSSESGAIELLRGDGSRIEIGPGGTVTIEAEKVVVRAGQVVLGDGGDEPVLKGRSFLAQYAAHVHRTGVGPTGPPIPAAEDALSQTVLIR
jgi:hypothetical protein